MNKISVKPLRLFRFNSVFMTTLISMISLCVVLCILFSVFFTNVMTDAAHKSSTKTSKLYLESIVDNMDLNIINVQQALTQLVATGDLNQLGTTSGASGNFVSSVTMAIASTAADNSLIDNISLHIHRQDRLLTSNFRSYVPASFSPRGDMIDLFEIGGINSVKIEHIGKESYVFYYDNELILARRYPVNSDSALGTIYCELDIDSFYNYTRSGDNSSIWVFDKYNNQIFSSVKNYPGEAVTALSSLVESGTDYISENGIAYFLAESEETGWNFLYIVEESSLSPGIGSILSIIIPIMLLILIVAALFSTLIARMLYRPFMRLLDSMENHDLFPSSPSENNSAFKNEFTYLTHTLSEVAERQERLNLLMRDTTDDILNRFFLNVLNGVPTSYESAKDVLASTQSPFRTNAQYIVCVIRRTDGAFDAQDVRAKSFVTSLRRHFSELVTNYNIYCRFLFDGSDMQIIVMCREDMSIIQIKKLVDDFESQIKKLSDSIKIPLRVASGQMYHSILDLNFSYKDALATLDEHSAQESHRTTLYIPAAQSVPEEDTSAESVPLMQNVPKINLAPKAQQLITLCLDGNTDGARIHYERVTEDIIISLPDLPEQIKCCKLFISAILDKIVKLEYINLESLPDDLFAFIKSEETYETSAALKEAVLAVCARIAEELGAIMKKQHNRYILAAKDYISQHYQDYDLSLTSIAEAINANPSYLSKLFKSNLGVYFTDYLNNFRIDRSLEMLKTTGDSVKDIAAACGFNSAQNYIRVFKKRLDMTPGMYRKNN